MFPLYLLLNLVDPLLFLDYCRNWISLTESIKHTNQHLPIWAGVSVFLTIYPAVRLFLSLISGFHTNGRFSVGYLSSIRQHNPALGEQWSFQICVTLPSNPLLCSVCHWKWMKNVTKLRKTLTNVHRLSETLPFIDIFLLSHLLILSTPQASFHPLFFLRLSHTQS